MKSNSRGISNLRGDEQQRPILKTREIGIISVEKRFISSWKFCFSNGKYVFSDGNYVAAAGNGSLPAGNI
jgi:hypothetical protein